MQGVWKGAALAVTVLLGSACEGIPRGEQPPSSGGGAVENPTPQATQSNEFGGEGCGIRLGPGAVDPGAGETVFVYLRGGNVPPSGGEELDDCASRFTWIIERRSAGGELLWNESLPWPIWSQYAPVASTPESLVLGPDGSIHVVLLLREPGDVGGGQAQEAGRYLVTFDSNGTFQDVMPVREDAPGRE